MTDEQHTSEAPTDAPAQTTSEGGAMDLAADLKHAIARRDGALAKARAAEAERDALRAQLDQLQPRIEAWRQSTVRSRLETAAGQRKVHPDFRETFGELLELAASRDGLDLAECDEQAFTGLVNDVLRKHKGLASKEPAPYPAGTPQLHARSPHTNRLLNGG